MHLFCVLALATLFSSFRPRVCSGDIGVRVTYRVEGHVGRQGRGDTRTLRRKFKFGTRPASVARGLGVQSRASWLFLQGLRSATPSRPGPWKPHHLIFAFRSAAAVTPSLQLSTMRQPRYNRKHTISTAGRIIV